MSLILFLKTTSVEKKKGFFPGSGGVSTHTTTIHIILCVSCGHGNQTERKPIKSHQKFKLLHGRLFCGEWQQEQPQNAIKSVQFAADEGTTKLQV